LEAQVSSLSSKIIELTYSEQYMIDLVEEWYVSNVSIIFDSPCLFIHHLLCVLLHFVAFLCIFRN
jgi:hypothetical protein